MCEAGHLTRAHPVFSGRPGQRLMLVGQAPGPVEDDVTRPFAGRAGAQLMRWFVRAGFSGESEVRDRVFMTSMTTCFPGRLANNAGDRRPSAAEVALCSSWLDAYLELLTPALIICVGGLAHSRFLPGRRLEMIVGSAWTPVGERVDGVPLTRAGAAASAAPVRAESVAQRPDACAPARRCSAAPPPPRSLGGHDRCTGGPHAGCSRATAASRCYDPRAVFGFATKVIQAVPETDAAPLAAQAPARKDAEDILERIFTPRPKASPAEQAERALRRPKQLIYCAISNKNFYWRQHITKFVLDEGGVPISPFMLFDYYLLHTVPKDTVREAFNNLIVRCDQMWVFGNLSLGVKVQIGIAKRLRKPLRFYDITDMPYRVVNVPEAMLREE